MDRAPAGRADGATEAAAGRASRLLHAHLDVGVHCVAAALVDCQDPVAGAAGHGSCAASELHGHVHAYVSSHHDPSFGCRCVSSSRLVLPPILTLLLLVFAFVLGVRVEQPRTALPALAVVWLSVMAANFVIAGVGDDDDVGAFILSAFVILLLAYGLWRLGRWLSRDGASRPRLSATMPRPAWRRSLGSPRTVAASRVATAPCPRTPGHTSRSPCPNPPARSQSLTDDHGVEDGTDDGPAPIEGPAPASAGRHRREWLGARGWPPRGVNHAPRVRNQCFVLSAPSSPTAPCGAPRGSRRRFGRRAGH